MNIQAAKKSVQSKIKHKKVLPSGHVVIVVPRIVTMVVLLFFTFGGEDLSLSKFK